MVSYQSPKHWAFEDTVQASDLQIYSDNLNHFRDNVIYLPHIAHSDAMPDARTVIHLHTARWLTYMSRSDGDSPTIWLLNKRKDKQYTTSVSGSSEPVTIDLETIPWLVKGMVYVVDDVRYAYESG